MYSFTIVYVQWQDDLNDETDKKLIKLMMI